MNTNKYSAEIFNKVILNTQPGGQQPGKSYSWYHSWGKDYCCATCFYAQGVAVVEGEEGEKLFECVYDGVWGEFRLFKTHAHLKAPYEI